MNSPLNVTNSRSRPPQALRAAQPDGAGNETDSGVFKLFESAILVVTSAADELHPAFRELEHAGFSLIVVSDPKSVEEMAFLPRFALIETALPGALELLTRVNTPEPVMHTLALLGPAEAEGPALSAGAALTLRGPLDPVTLLLCMRRFHAQDELARQPRHVFQDQDRGNVPTTVLESVLATIGHEIQNPLAAALACVECLREPELARLGEQERLAAVDDVAIALRRIRDVMGAVTSLVKGTAPDLSRLSLWECAERAVDALRSPHVRIEIAGDEKVRAFANGALLEQVLVNLLQNAIDATVACETPRILVRVYRAGLEARISIRDNGPGVPFELRQRIFEPFFTTKGEHGTGLGLVLVHHAVARMGGVVTLGPARTGAVFRVRLRAA